MRRAFVKTVDFQVISLQNPGGHEVVLVYSLGEDGVIRVFNGKSWAELAIEEDDG